MCYSIFSKLKMDERNIMRLINRFFNVAKRCFVLGLTIFLLAGCSSGGSSSSEKEKDDSPKIYMINETADVDGAKYTVTGVERSAGDAVFTPDEGNEFVIVSVHIENNSSDDLSYNPYYFKVTNSKGQKTGMTISGIDGQLDSGELTDGGSVDGKVVFEEPIGDTDLTMQITNVFLQEEETVKFALQ